LNAQQLENTLDAILEQVHQAFGLPGLAVGVVQGNEIVYARGFGVCDIGTQAPVTTRSLFHQASISKLFVATAIVQLVEQGRLRLDDAIVRHLPYFWLGDDADDGDEYIPVIRSQSITIQQALTHTSGLPDLEDHGWHRPEVDEGALERRVRTLRSLHMVAEPGQGFAYSSLAFDVLGALIAHVSGEPFETCVKRAIFEPLGMHDSTFFKPDVPPVLATSPHIRTPGLAVSDVFPYSRACAPSGALQSNVLDMCNWALANLALAQPSQGWPRRILSPASHRLLWQPYAQTGHDDTRQAAIGLGYFLGQYRGTPVVMHDGGDVGYEAELTLLPERPVAVVVMANVFPAATDAITRALLDAVLGFDARPPSLPLMVPLLATLHESGLDAAVAQAGQLDRAAYDASEAFLRNVVFILQEAHRPAEAIEVLKLGQHVYPAAAWLSTDLARLSARAQSARQSEAESEPSRANP
jgi:CubicO group peptidase (beta-lactamase class C family)